MVTTTSKADYGNEHGRRPSVYAEAFNPAEDDGVRTFHYKSDDQLQRLADSVKKIFLFQSLDEAEMREVLDAMKEREVKPDEWIINQGEDGDFFYVIERGVFSVYVLTKEETETKIVNTYDNYGSFGELALLYSQPRAASVKAETEGALWCLDRKTFRRICLRSAYKKRVLYEKLIDCVPMLKALRPYELLNLADALMPRTFKDGEQIIKQGDRADGMYFIESGEVRITRLGDKDQEVEVNRVHKGGYFGELALVTKKPRAASAYAVGDINLAFLDVDAFERLLGPCMDIMKRNIDDYEEQLVKIFGSKINITDIP